MKLGIVADLHFNIDGLDRALATIGPIDALLCLGDSIYEPSLPNRARGPHRSALSARQTVGELRQQAITESRTSEAAAATGRGAVLTLITGSGAGKAHNGEAWRRTGNPNPALSRRAHVPPRPCRELGRLS